MTDSHSVWNTELLADVAVTELSVQCVRVRGQIIFKRHLMLTIDLSITYPAHRDIKASRGEINGGILRQQFQSSQLSIIYPLSSCYCVPLWSRKSLQLSCFCSPCLSLLPFLFLFLFLILFWIMHFLALINQTLNFVLMSLSHSF